MTFILLFIRTHLGATCIALFLLTQSIALAYARYEVTGLKAEISVCNAEHASLIQSNTSLLAALKEQNKAIADIKKTSDAKHAETQEAINRRQSSSKSTAKKAHDLWNFIPPAQDECSQLKLILQRYSSR